MVLSDSVHFPSLYYVLLVLQATFCVVNAFSLVSLEKFRRVLLFETPFVLIFKARVIL